MEIKQFDFNLDRFHYIIEDTGIRLIKKRIASSSDTFVDFEDIGSKVIKENTRKLVWIGLSILFLIIAIAVFINRTTGGRVGNGAEIFHLTASLLFLIIFLLTRKNILFLAQADNTNAIEFIASNRYREKVDNFIKGLLQTRDRYLIKKYALLDELLPYTQQYNNLVWLYNLNLLTKEQLKKKIDELDRQETNLVNGNKSGLTKITGFQRESFNNDPDEEIENE